MTILRAASVVVAGLLGVSLPALATDLHHDITLKIEPKAGTVAIVDALTVGDAGPLEIDLRLFEGARIERLSLNGAALSPGAPPLVRAARGSRLVVAYSGAPASPGPHLISPDGVFLPGEGGWLPGSPGATESWTLEATVPAPYVVTATGSLVDEAGDRRRIRHRSSGDGEPPSVFAGRWQVDEQQADGIRIRTYFPDEARSLAPHYLDQAGRYLQAFSSDFGAYAYDGFHIVASGQPVGLAFPGVTYVSERILALPFMQGRSLAHEILHSWWGGAVGIDPATGNWAEGLTTYLADHGLAAAASKSAARAMRYAWLRDFAALPAAWDRPARQFTARHHDASQVIGYGKVAFIFHMLRREIGNEAFRSGLQRFYIDNRFQVASWHDLEAAFEATSGRTLDWYFTQWLDRPGAPALVLNGVGAGRAADNRFGVELSLGQAGGDWRLAVPVVIATDAGPRRETIRLEAPSTKAGLVVADRPLSVAVDPDYDVFRRLAPEEAPPILRDVTLDPAAIAVLLTETATAAEAARAAAESLLAPDASVHTALPTVHDAVPMLLIGTRDLVAAASERLALKPPGEYPADAGSGRAWAGRLPGGAAVLVIAAADADGLAIAGQRLRHYRRAGWVVFDEGKVVDHGTWPVAGGPLTRSLTPQP